MDTNEKDFDPKTMTRATQEDVDRMYERLWGSKTHGQRIIKALVKNNPKVEYLDLTQEFYLYWHSNTNILELPKE